MALFTPTSSVSIRQDDADALGAAVIASLTRPTFRKLSLGLLPTVALTLFSAGILQLVVMGIKLRRFVANQEHQFWHLAEWMRLQAPPDESAELRSAVQRIRVNPILSLLATLFLLTSGFAVATHFSNFGMRFSFHEFYRFAYHVPVTKPQILFTFAISAAAACHWAQLAWHQQNAERFLRWFGAISSQHEGLDDLALPRLELGFRTAWLATGILLSAGTGAVWIVPVFLAAAAHRQYAKVASTQTRFALAERARTMIARRRPALRVPTLLVPLAAKRQCIRPNCRAALPTEARFCPRCGTPAREVASNVA